MKYPINNNVLYNIICLIYVILYSDILTLKLLLHKINYYFETEICYVFIKSLNLLLMKKIIYENMRMLIFPFNLK